MSKVTSKLQVTVPKVIAEQYGICPGDEIDWVSAGDSIRVIPPGGSEPALDIRARLELFDQATQRQQSRDACHAENELATDRGWTREELYDRGRSRRH
jgi:bifunctional DNA-binding transcriptional regulator/antitoxin component of YhaV-PrlF toxin-antitoxin module